MNEQSEKPPTEYMPPALVEVGEFNEDTLGNWEGTAPDYFFNFYW